MSLAHTVRVVSLALLLLPVAVSAQGSIAAQGFGYPPGQLTVRGSSTGGTMTEFDHSAPHNPAALMYWGVAGAYAQYSPERRSTSVNGRSTSSTVSIFPVFAIGLPAGSRYSFGLSSSTMLERNYTLTTTARQRIRSDSVTTTSSFRARGAMNDVQFGGAMQIRGWLRGGAAIHLITGSNRLNVSRSILPDTGVVRVDSVSYEIPGELSTATFTGSAVSFGVEITPGKHFSVAASTRLGFGLDAELNDSTKTSADTPNRAGLAARYDLSGNTIAVRYNWEGWSAMRGLGATTNGVFDTREYGIGAEIPGPRIRGGQFTLRLGARRRDLPFGVAGVQPKETAFGGGLGLPLAFGRVQLDFGLERATRTVPGLSSVKERGTTASFGFRLRT
jgi:hypothetical protein